MHSSPCINHVVSHSRTRVREGKVPRTGLQLVKSRVHGHRPVKRVSYASASRGAGLCPRISDAPSARRRVPPAALWRLQAHPGRHAGVRGRVAQLLRGARRRQLPAQAGRAGSAAGPARQQTVAGLTPGLVCERACVGPGCIFLYLSSDRCCLVSCFGVSLLLLSVLIQTRHVLHRLKCWARPHCCHS